MLPGMYMYFIGRLCFLRYCEFSRVNLEKSRIDEACLHVDIIGVMHQAGHYPLPPPTGIMLNPTPGPMTHDGILTQPQARYYRYEHLLQLYVLFYLQDKSLIFSLFIFDVL